MRKGTNFPPEWQAVALICPKCKATPRARHNPNTGALEALRCFDCDWSENYVKIAVKRKARLYASVHRFAPTHCGQTDIEY